MANKIRLLRIIIYVPSTHIGVSFLAQTQLVAPISVGTHLDARSGERSSGERRVVIAALVPSDENHYHHSDDKYHH